MKSMRYLLAISLAIVPLVANACWHPWTLYNSTTLFRLDTTKSEKHNIRETNCRHWQSLTHKDIPLSDIEYVVYTMSLKEYETFYASAVYFGNNTFAHWIKRNDREIMDFLLLAKRNEELRFRYSSKWYYPTMKVGGPITLEEVVEESLSSTSSRLRDRYLLQAVRALTTLNRYDDCLKLWNDEISLLPEDNFMRRLCYDYVAGAYYHTGDTDTAMMIYASRGDTNSMYYIARLEDMDLTNVDIIDYSYRSGAPLSEYSGYIRRIIVDAETFPNVDEVGDKPVITDELIAVRDLAIEAGNNPNCADRAQWLYIAAYIYAQQGRLTHAKRYVEMAEAQPASDYMKESIGVLKFYLDAQTATYNDAFEAYLYQQLKWLDDNLCQECKSKGEISSYYWGDFSDYYWFSTMKRIISFTVAPRYFDIGNPARALQLLNFVEYLPYKYAPTIEYGFYVYFDDYGYGDGYYNCCEGSLDDYRKERRIFNYIDYSTYFFNKFESQTPDAAIAYVERALNPITEFDRYLNAVGYTSSDFLYDVVGTICLRHMRYQEAERYFTLVSLDYEYMLNVSLDRDPFDALNTSGRRIMDFRYSFATTMASLERGMAITTDPNRRAKLQFKFGIGMGNSVKDCWPLTHYGLSYGNDWTADSITTEVQNRAIGYINEALLMFTDPELEAQAHYALGHLKTVAEDYYFTETSRYVRRHCDNYVDYTPSLFKRR